MSIHSDRQQTQEDAKNPIQEHETIVQPMGPPPQPPLRPPGAKSARWFTVSALLIVLVLVLTLGSVLVVQLARSPTMQPTSTPSTTTRPTPTPSVGPYHPINALWASDATTGWARTNSQRILHTTDGGKNWQDVTPPYPAGSTVAVPPAFASLNANVAWVAIFEKQQPDGTIPNVVFHTSDAGHSWQQAILPTAHLGASQVQFVNTQDGWVLASFGGGAAGSQAVDLFRSTDGGQTWTLVAQARAGSPPNSIPGVGQKTGMSWASATTGWITGSIAAAQNTVYLYRTQDGGVSWQPQSLPLPAVQAVITTEPPVFFSATEGLLPVTFFTGGSTSFMLYATHDGGATWSSSTLLSSVSTVWDFVTMQQGWVVGANGSSLNVTSDGGLHWTAITPSANFQHISQLDFVTAQVGWAISTASRDTPVLLKTMDGGHTWVQVSAPPAVTPFKVTSVDLTVNPNSIAGQPCGSTASFTYLATFHIPAGTAGGKIDFSYTLNNGRSQTFETMTVGAGETSKTFTFTSSGTLPPDHTYPGIAQVMVTSPNTVISPQVQPTGVCVAPGAFQVTSVTMTVSPSSIASTTCGTPLTVTYTATFHLVPNGPGGTIRFEYTINNGRGTNLASLVVAAGQTTATYSFVWSGNLPPDHTYPGPGGVIVQSPNVISSLLVGPSGICS